MKIDIDALAAESLVPATSHPESDGVVLISAEERDAIVAELREARASTRVERSPVAWRVVGGGEPLICPAKAIAESCASVRDGAEVRPLFEGDAGITSQERSRDCLSFEGNGKVAVQDVDALVKSPQFQRQVQAVRELADGSAPKMKMPQNGIALIAAERQRQIEKEGWTPEHDDEHKDHSLAMAAALYATPLPVFTKDERAAGVMYMDPWPWDDSWDKRPRFTDTYGLMDADAQGVTMRVRCLEKAGALIAAEIDRLQRFAPDQESGGHQHE